MESVLEKPQDTCSSALEPSPKSESDRKNRTGVPENETQLDTVRWGGGEEERTLGAGDALAVASSSSEPLREMLVVLGDPKSLCLARGPSNGTRTGSAERRAKYPRQSGSAAVSRGSLLFERRGEQRDALALAALRVLGRAPKSRRTRFASTFKRPSVAVEISSPDARHESSFGKSEGRRSIFLTGRRRGLGAVLRALSGRARLPVFGPRRARRPVLGKR